MRKKKHKKRKTEHDFLKGIFSCALKWKGKSKLKMEVFYNSRMGTRDTPGARCSWLNIWKKWVCCGPCCCPLLLFLPPQPLLCQDSAWHSPSTLAWLSASGCCCIRHGWQTLTWCLWQCLEPSCGFSRETSSSALPQPGNLLWEGLAVHSAEQARLSVAAM